MVNVTFTERKVTRPPGPVTCIKRKVSATFSFVACTLVQIAVTMVSDAATLGLVACTFARAGRTWVSAAAPLAALTCTRVHTGDGGALVPSG